MIFLISVFLFVWVVGIDILRVFEKNVLKDRRIGLKCGKLRVVRFYL